MTQLNQTVSLRRLATCHQWIRGTKIKFIKIKKGQNEKGQN